jgi:putative ABC transport system ATP-binding protein
VIQVVHISKVYGKKKNIFTALAESGSGKSTAMHIMSGLDVPTSGDVVIDDESLATMKQRRKDTFRSKKMSFIFQSFFVEGNQTCYQNVSLPLEIAKVPLLKRKQLIMDALTQVDLAEKANEKAKNLSGGQKQRLAIARAIVNKPSIIFADEPTGNLDSNTGDKVVDLLFRLNKELGITLIIVTHDEELAQQCQVKVTMRDGKIISVKDQKGAGK